MRFSGSFHLAELVDNLGQKKEDSCFLAMRKTRIFCLDCTKFAIFLQQTPAVLPAPSPFDQVRYEGQSRSMIRGRRVLVGQFSHP